ncbi:MAG: DUF3795 domain-containing protein [Candidatus Thorarchaeota archaeon]
MILKGEKQFLSCCGRYYCAYCGYHRGTMAGAAKNLLGFVERSGSIRLIVEYKNACNFDEFMKGLQWLASQENPCSGCRFGGGWSWWPDCPVRLCTKQKEVSFCFECSDFPCEKLQADPSTPEPQWKLDSKKAIIEANNQIIVLGVNKWIKQVKSRYNL